MSFKDKAVQFGSLTGVGFLATQVLDFVTPFNMSWQENGLAGAVMAAGVMTAYKVGKKGGVSEGDVINAGLKAKKRFGR